MLSSPATNKETDSPRECRQGPKACHGPRRPAAGRAGAGGGKAEARQLPPGLEVLEEILVIACPPQHSCCEQPDLGGRGPLSEGGGPRGPQGYLGRGAGGGWHRGGFKNFLILDFSWVFHDIYNNNVEVLFVCFFVFLGGGEVICLREREGQGSLGGLRSDRLRAARGWSGRPGLPCLRAGQQCPLESRVTPWARDSSRGTETTLRARENIHPSARLLSVCHVPGTVPGSKDGALRKTDERPALFSAVGGRGQTDGPRRLDAGRSGVSPWAALVTCLARPR